MTLNTLVAQLREKAAKARASRSDYCPMTFHVAPSNLEYLEIATPGNLTTILDAFDEMRDFVKRIELHDHPDERYGWQEFFERCDACVAKQLLARLDAEIGGEE